MRGSGSVVLGLLINYAACPLIEHWTKRPVRKPLRQIDLALDGRANDADTRRLHAIYTTALDGVGRAAQEADDLGMHREVSELRAESSRLDAIFSMRIKNPMRPT
jgi:hypothetical protein